MLIAGAGSHALEILDILLRNDQTSDICFFDDVSASIKSDVLNQYPIIRDQKKLELHLREHPAFVLGTGNSVLREKLANLLTGYGGILESVISNTALLSSLDVSLGKGLNIMHRVVIEPGVKIGEGTLINAGVLVHHESVIGKYCQVCPGSVLTGNVVIGDYCMIGSGAIILPKVHVGKNVVVAAGSVVINNLPDNVMAAGSPAVIKKNILSK
ncbi:MAG: acetyltransferase [Ferruginibacter sp.]